MIKYNYKEKRKYKYKYKYYGGVAESPDHHFLRRNHQLETTQLQSFKGGIVIDELIITIIANTIVVNIIIISNIIVIDELIITTPVSLS